MFQILVSLPLSIIFNKLLSTSKYPTASKKCVVIPLFKAGNKLSCRNYRSISLSITLSKIFEKCIKIRVLELEDIFFYIYNLDLELTFLQMMLCLGS